MRRRFSVASRAPERLLTRQDLEYLTGFAKKHILAMLNDANAWKKPGGSKLIGGEWRLPTSFYNQWVASCDAAAPEKREVAHA
jgi:predicted DNA-binding transcriptional regulator AlpA